PSSVAPSEAWKNRRQRKNRFARPVQAPAPAGEARGMLECRPDPLQEVSRMARIALVQFSGNTSKDVNVRKAEDLARQAAGNGAKIVCFPELCTTTYFCYENNPAFFDLAEPVPGPAVDRMRTVAR